MYLEEKPTRTNPYFVPHISVDRDLYPKGFTDEGLIVALNGLGETRRDYDMLMEKASFEEIDDYYNPGLESIALDFIFEAIVVEKFKKTEHRMAAVVRVINRHLAESDISALDPVIGKPRKSGQFAYVTVEIPFSDGQSVFVVFHAPEGDKQKITADDKIIAFRWLLNKRDITQTVSPEEGAEVSLDTIGKRIAQLVEKNSARFVRQQKDVLEEQKALENAQDNLKSAEQQQVELSVKVAEAAKEKETVFSQLTSTLAQLEKQKSINAELEVKLEGLKKAGEPAGSGEGEKEKENQREQPEQTANNETAHRDIPQDRITQIDENITSDELNNALRALAGKDLYNEIAGITAQVNSEQRKKMGSQVATEVSMKNGFAAGEHKAVAAKVENIWRYAAEAQIHADIKNNQPDLTIHRFASPVNIKGRESFAWITVKESKGEYRIYSIELVDEKKLRDKVGSGAQDATTTLHRSFDEIIAELKKTVNPQDDKQKKLVAGDEVATVDGNCIRILSYQGKFDKKYSSAIAAYSGKDNKFLFKASELSRARKEPIFAIRDQGKTIPLSDIGVNATLRINISEGDLVFPDGSVYFGVYTKPKKDNMGSKIEASETTISDSDGSATNTNDEPAFVTTLNDIIAGKHGDDAVALGVTLKDVLQQMKAANVVDKYHDLFQQALDVRTNILKKKMESM